MAGWTKEFENALSWFASAPKRIVNAASDAISDAMDTVAKVGEAAIKAAAEAGDAAMQKIKDTVGAAAEWVWVVLQGDFAEEQTTAQIVTGTVISMIPFVDQICDARDIVANSCAIYNHDEEKDGSSTWKWVALVLTLMGFIPCVGSFFKGVFKVLFLYVRKAFAKTAGKAGIKIWDIAKPYVETGIAELNKYLQRPEVKATLAKLKIDNIYKSTAEIIREAAKAISPKELLKHFDDLISKLKDMLEFIKKWTPDSIVRQAENLGKIIDFVRKKADSALSPVLGPVNEFLEKVAKRLDDEHKAAYKATTGAHNPRKAFVRVKESDEIAVYDKGRPGYVSELTPKMPHQQMDKGQFKAAWKQAAADNHAGKISQMPPDLLQAGPTKGAYNTFSDLRADVVPEGHELYRIVDPSSGDNSICWMSKAEFEKLRSKDDWRKNFAVWVNWNGNGEFDRYVVPPGGLPVWRGTTASQNLDGTKHMLEGGAEQIVIDPKQLDERFMDARQPTNWGYDDPGHTADLTGVPTLKRNWLTGRNEKEEAEYLLNRTLDQWDE